MTLDNKLDAGDLKSMTKLVSGLSLLVAGIGYFSSFIGFKNGFDDVCYSFAGASLLGSLIMYKSSSKQL